MTEIVLSNHTPEFMEALLSSSPDIRAKIVVAGSPEVVIRDTDDLQVISIKDSLYDDNFVGTFQKTSATIKVINYDAKYDLIDKRFNIYIGVGYYNELDEYIVEYEDMGTYICYKTSDYRTEIELEIEAYNLSYLFEAKIPSNIVSYPTTVINYLEAICEAVGVELATPTFPNSTLPLAEAPYLEEGATYRDAVRMVAEASGGHAKIKHDNQLYIEFFDNSNPYEIGDYSDLKQEKLVGPYNVVVLGRSPQEDNIVYPSTLPENPVELRIDNNQIVDKVREVAILPIYGSVNGFSYYPMEIEVVGNMLVQAGDYVEYKDLNENTIINPVFEHILEYDGSLVSKYNTFQQSKSSTNYRYAGSIEKRVINTELRVDKNSNEIIALINQTSELGDQLTELTQSINGFEFKVQEAGNMNLIENSVGWNDSKYWELVGAGVVSTNQTSELKDNSTSKSGFSLNNITMKQEIQCKPNTKYSMCAVANNISNDIAHLKIINGAEVLYLFNINTIVEWERYDLSFVSLSNRITIEVYSISNNLTITDLVLSEGELIQSWYPAPNEIYTANVKIDRDGINISNSSSETRTVINASEFAVYAGNDKSITVNRDITILQKAEILQGFTVGRLRFDVKTNGVDATIID